MSELRTVECLHNKRRLIIIYPVGWFCNMFTQQFCCQPVIK